MTKSIDVAFSSAALRKMYSANQSIYHANIRLILKSADLDFCFTPCVLFSEPARSSSVQPRGRAQEEVPGDHQPQQHGSRPGGAAQELVDALGAARHASAACDGDPGDPREHAVAAGQAPPKALVQAELAVGDVAGGRRLEAARPRRRHHGHRAHPHQGSGTQLPNQAQHPGHLREGLSSGPAQEEQPL